jgi:predicted acetyltransferase
MNEIKLVKPSAEYAEQIWAYRTEFEDYNDELHGSAGLEDVATVAEWLANIEMNSCEETVRKGLVPATTFLAVREVDNQLVGMIDIRHRLNDYLLNFGGHIGYSIRPTARRKGYATAMLRLALAYCHETLKLEKVLITCDKENIASAKTIIANGGLLENEIQEEQRTTQRYWVNLKK